jgi:Tol biopolymer transport system component
LRSCSAELVAGFDTTGIKVRNLLNGSEKRVYQFGASPSVVLPVLSHDGQAIAFVEGPSVLRVVSSDGGPARDLAKANSPAELQTLWGAAWSPDDRFIYFARRADSKSPYELLRVPIGGGTPENAGLKVEDIRDLDIAPDGTRIAFSIGAVNRPEIWAIQKFLPVK